MTHTMATEIEVFNGVPDLSIVEHREGAASQIRVGTQTIHLRAAECFLFPPDRPFQAVFDTISVGVTTLSFEDLQRDATGRIDQDAVELDFDGWG